MEPEPVAERNLVQTWVILDWSCRDGTGPSDPAGAAADETRPQLPMLGMQRVHQRIQIPVRKLSFGSGRVQSRASCFPSSASAYVRASPAIDPSLIRLLYHQCSTCEKRSYQIHDPMHVFLRFDRPVDFEVKARTPLFPNLYKKPAGTSSDPNLTGPPRTGSGSIEMRNMGDPTGESRLSMLLACRVLG